MSSLVIKVLLFCLASSLATFAAIDKTTTSGAATAFLSINGEPLRVASKALCDPGVKVKISFNLGSNSAFDNFRALRKTSPGTKLAECPSTIDDEHKIGIATFTDDDYLLDGAHALGETICQSKKSTKGNGVLCIYPPSSSSENSLIAQAKYNFDTAEAAIEEIYGKMALNGKIIFSASVKDAVEPIKVETCYGKEILGDITGKDCSVPFTSKITDGETVKITGLDNNEQYIFKIRLVMPNGKYSDWRGNFYATPIPAAFPIDTIEGKGEDIGWNCQSSQSGFSFVLVFLVLAIFMGRKFFMSLLKNNLFLLLAGSLVLSTSFSKQSFAYTSNYSFGLLGSMYRPDLDSQKLANGKSIFPFYKTFFRREAKNVDGPINPLIGAEFDWTFFNGFGSAQLGIGAGYTYVSGHPVVIEAGKPNPNKPIPNASTSLHMYQIRPQLTYLFDHFAEAFPIFPYIRGSLIAHGFSFRDLGEQPEAVGVKNANGFRFGYQAGAGLMLKLDFLEPSAVADARSSGNFQHVYLKSDLSYSRIDGFHRPGYIFSAKDVMGTSLPLLWTFGLVFAI